MLESAPLGSSNFTTLAERQRPGLHRDPGHLRPDGAGQRPYVLRLTATDITGRTSQTTIIVEADTATKPTQYLRSETDLSVTLAGSVFNLVRTYDSLDRRPVGHVRLRLAAGQPGHGHPDDRAAHRPRVDRASTTRS